MPLIINVNAFFFYGIYDILYITLEQTIVLDKSTLFLMVMIKNNFYFKKSLYFCCKYQKIIIFSILISYNIEKTYKFTLY